jgi:hypothetical protein
MSAAQEARSDPEAESEGDNRRKRGRGHLERLRELDPEESHGDGGDVREDWGRFAPHAGRTTSSLAPRAGRTAPLASGCAPGPPSFFRVGQWSTDKKERKVSRSLNTSVLLYFFKIGIIDFRSNNRNAHEMGGVVGGVKYKKDLPSGSESKNGFEINGSYFKKALKYGYVGST